MIARRWRERRWKRASSESTSTSSKTTDWSQIRWITPDVLLMIDIVSTLNEPCLACSETCNFDVGQFWNWVGKPVCFSNRQLDTIIPHLRKLVLGKLDKRVKVLPKKRLSNMSSFSTARFLNWWVSRLSTVSTGDFLNWPISRLTLFSTCRSQF